MALSGRLLTLSAASERPVKMLDFASERSLASRLEKRGSVTQVEIFGQTYNVRAEGDSTYIHDLARLVDSRMKEVAERTATVDTTKIAILAALNISDDLYQTEKRRSADPADSRARAERLIRKLDDALGA
jgi:cell division protein ZapA